MKKDEMIQRRAKAINLYLDGYDAKSICELCNVSQATLYRYLAWVTKNRKPGRKK